MLIWAQQVPPLYSLVLTINLTGLRCAYEISKAYLSVWAMRTDERVKICLNMVGTIPYSRNSDRNERKRDSPISEVSLLFYPIFIFLFFLFSFSFPFLFPHFPSSCSSSLHILSPFWWPWHEPCHDTFPGMMNWNLWNHCLCSSTKTSEEHIFSFFSQRDEGQGLSFVVYI